MEEGKFVSKKRKMTDDILNASIETLVAKGMRTDCVSKLNRLGIFNIGQLLNSHTADITEATRIGTVSDYPNIHNIIMGMGLSFYEDRLKWKELGISEEIAFILVEKLNLSTHIKNAVIRRGGYRYLGDLLSVDYSKLFEIRTLGEVGVIELKKYIHSLGLSFNNEELTVKETKEEYRKKGVPLIEETLGLDSRTSAVLYNNGIYTLDQLISCGSQVFNLAGMGNVKSKRLKEALENKNITFTIPDVASLLDSTIPSETIKRLTEQENEAIRERMETKRQLLNECELLVKKREELLRMEQQLNEEIASKIAMLQAIIKKEEGPKL